jgi:signal transduction histidine kinase
MAFTVEEFHDLIRLLEQHPEWRADLRRLLLSDEILSLPDVVRELAHEVRLLAEAQKRTEERLLQLEEQVRELVHAQKLLTATVDFLRSEVGELKGDSLERRYRERAASYFQSVLRRIRVVDHQRLGVLLDDAVDAGRIPPEDRQDLLGTDVVVAGLRDGREVYLVAEVSGVVTFTDARRAFRRAAILEAATGLPVLPAVAGHRLSDDRETQEEAARVWRVLDGRVEEPSAAS